MAKLLVGNTNVLLTIVNICITSVTSLNNTLSNWIFITYGIWGHSAYKDTKSSK